MFNIEDMLDRRHYENVLKPPLEAENLPPWCYTDEGFHRLEIERIFEGLEPGWPDGFGPQSRRLLSDRRCRNSDFPGSEPKRRHQGVCQLLPTPGYAIAVGRGQLCGCRLPLSPLGI